MVRLEFGLGGLGSEAQLVDTFGYLSMPNMLGLGLFENDLCI